MNPFPNMKLTHTTTLLSAIAGLALSVAAAVAADKGAKNSPFRALMITGGCCHDYTMQKEIVSVGISKRVPTEWTIFHSDDQAKSREYMSHAGWADGFDYVVYNHCFAQQNDVAFIDSVAAVHEAGLPAVALHCAMHSFHWNVDAVDGAEKTWPKLLGVSSTGHGPHAQITVSKVAEQKNHPIVKNLPDRWTTPEGELYNVQKVLPTATVLAYGENGVAKNPQACIWVNTYGKARVFGTTIGHHNSTMTTPEFLDLLGDGVRWITEQP
jgi:type 1 glutamine amidotransferase